MCFSHLAEQKAFIKANCTNNINRKGFLQLLHLKVCMLLLFSPHYISREERNKQILFTKDKFSFPYVDIEFDVVKCK